MSWITILHGIQLIPVTLTEDRYGKIEVKENTIPRKDEVRCARCKRAAIMTRYRKRIGKDN